MPVHPLWNAYNTASDDQIAAAFVIEPPVVERVEVVAPDPTWPNQFIIVRDRISVALGELAVNIEHVGSTSVPGLRAKPLIDVDLTVPDSSDEAAWLPHLEAVGFQLRVREPEWEEHRCLRGHDPLTNLHVWSVGAREPQRHAMFRDWLRQHRADRDLYANVKQSVAELGFTNVMHYNNEKGWVIYDIYERIFAADPAHPHDPQPREPAGPLLTDPA